MQMQSQSNAFSSRFVFVLVDFYPFNRTDTQVKAADENTAIFRFHFTKPFTSFTRPPYLNIHCKQFYNRVNNYTCICISIPIPCSRLQTLHFVRYIGLVHWNCKCILIEFKCHTPKKKKKTKTPAHNTNIKKKINVSLKVTHWHCFSESEHRCFVCCCGKLPHTLTHTLEHKLINTCGTRPTLYRSSAHSVLFK